MADFARAIKDYDPELLTTVFSYELDNETFFIANQPPFSIMKGTCTPANGKTYDLASEQALQDMVDDMIE